MPTLVALSATPVPCPVCERPVMPERCEPWPADLGPAPWHCGCYGGVPREHYVGANGDDELDAIRNYNIEAGKIGRPFT